jgi:antitoxin HicB
MFDYSVKLEHDKKSGAVMVYFRDLPNVFSAGNDEDEALLNAIDALETALDASIRQREPFVLPRVARSKTTVRLPAQAAVKALLHNEMLTQGIRKSTLARRMNAHMPQIDRLLDVRHGSRLDALEAAFAALGKQLDVSVG